MVLLSSSCNSPEEIQTTKTSTYTAAFPSTKLATITVIPTYSLNPTNKPTLPLNFISTITPLPTQTAALTPETSELALPTQVSWDPDIHIAYIKKSLDEAYHDNALYIINSEGNQINVFDGLPGVRGSYFSWSTNGSWLLFSEYDQEVFYLLEDDTDTRPRPFTLWIVRPDGTERHRLVIIDHESSINWSSDEKKFLVNCPVSQSDLGICIVFSDSGEVITTEHIGNSPQFSPDGQRYAFIKDDKEIYIVSHNGSTLYRVFSTETGRIPGYSWSADQGSIITAVVNKPGCGNELDGATTFLLVNIISQEIQILRDVKWSINGWNLSPDQNNLLTSWWLCVGNAYDLDGVIGLNSDLITWPLDRFVMYEWTQDGIYMIGTDWISGQKHFIDPTTGKYLRAFGANFLDTLLNESPDITIQWEAQPISTRNDDW